MRFGRCWWWRTVCDALINSWCVVLATVLLMWDRVCVGDCLWGLRLEWVAGPVDSYGRRFWFVMLGTALFRGSRRRLLLCDVLAVAWTRLCVVVESWIGGDGLIACEFPCCWIWNSCRDCLKENEGLGLCVVSDWIENCEFLEWKTCEFAG